MTRPLCEQILAHDPFQRSADVDRNDPAAIEARFREMAQRYAAESPYLVAWVQQSNPLPKCYR